MELFVRDPLAVKPSPRRRWPAAQIPTCVEVWLVADDVAETPTFLARLETFPSVDTALTYAWACGAAVALVGVPG